LSSRSPDHERQQQCPDSSNRRISVRFQTIRLLPEALDGANLGMSLQQTLVPDEMLTDAPAPIPELEDEFSSPRAPLPLEQLAVRAGSWRRSQRRR
jgi:hypothetical protein